MLGTAMLLIGENSRTVAQGVAAKLNEIDEALRASEQESEWTPAAAARLSEIRESLRQQTQADATAEARTQE